SSLSGWSLRGTVAEKGVLVASAYCMGSSFAIPTDMPPPGPAPGMPGMPGIRGPPGRPPGPALPLDPLAACFIASVGSLPSPLPAVLGLGDGPLVLAGLDAAFVGARFQDTHAARVGQAASRDALAILGMEGDRGPFNGLTVQGDLALDTAELRRTAG